MGAPKTTNITRRLSRFLPFSSSDPHASSTSPSSEEPLQHSSARSDLELPPSSPPDSKMSGKLTKTPRGHFSSLALVPAEQLPPQQYPHAPPHPYSATVSSHADIFLPPPPTLRDPSGVPLYSGSSSAPNSPSYRPLTPNMSVPDLTKTYSPPSKQQEKKKKKKHHFFGKSHHKEENPIPDAWIIGAQEHFSYDLTALLSAQPVPELWDESGDTFVHLFPATSHKGPSFKVHSSLYAASKTLSALAHGTAYSVGSEAGSEYRQPRSRPQSRNAPPRSSSLATPPLTPEQFPDRRKGSSGSSHDMYARMSGLELTPRETHLYLPLTLSTDSVIQAAKTAELRHSAQDIEALVIARNLFAFLMGQSLIATNEGATVYSTFTRISELLARYDFSNLDGSTFGEMAAMSFDRYVDELAIADVRGSGEKVIEALILGERMRSTLLYNEGFVHAAGKYPDLTSNNSASLRYIGPITRTRLERASLDVSGRLTTLKTKLDNFDFPAIFSGIMTSKTSDERKEVNFPEWRNAFMMMRKFTLNYYKHRFGDWPPKASSKKNELETSGLNRLVVKELYQDFATLYDLLVNRRNITTRTLGAAVNDSGDQSEAELRALRRVLDEYDRSTPPIQPPVPFDVPLLPTLATTREGYGSDAKKDTKARSKKLKGEEIARILRGSYNIDADIQTPFLDAFKNAEHRAAHGCNITDIVDLRVGQWIFLYAVLQSLPMLAVDAPQARYSRGVEYFLCVPPRSNAPWMRVDERGNQRSWYGVGGSGSSTALVSFPTDVVEFSVEGVYKRSHCWIMAQKWAAQAGLVPPTQIFPNSPSTSSPTFYRGQDHLAPPTHVSRVPVGGAPMNDQPRPVSARSSSPISQSHRNSSIFGPEQISVPSHNSSGSLPPPPRQTLEVDPKKTFDAIIGDMENQKKKKK